MSYDYSSSASGDILEKIQTIYKTASRHPAMVSARNRFIDSFAFYDGENQFPPYALEKLRRRRQDHVIVNKTANFINQASGVEIQSRLRVAYRSQSKNPEEELLAKALSHFCFFIQEDQDIPYFGSLKFRDALICGIGWSNIYYHLRKYCYEYFHSSNILYDADDLSPQLTNMKYVNALHWLSYEDIQINWPKHAAKLKDYFNTFYDTSYSPEYYNRNSAYTDTNSLSESGARRLVVEVQHKKVKNYFEGVDTNGYNFQTFNEEEAVAMAGSEKNLEEKKGTQIMRGVFCNDILLEYGPLNPNLPNMQDYTYVPVIFRRRTSDGVPVGWQESMKPTQMLINFTKTKEMAAMNSMNIIAEDGSFPGMSPAQVADIMSDPGAVIYKAPGTEIIIKEHHDAANSYAQAGERNDRDLEQVSGFYRTSLGDAKSGESGISKQIDQLNSMRSQVPWFDNLKLMKKREGKVLLDLIQGSGTDNMMAHILDEEEEMAVIMNLARTVNGKKVIFNDVRTIPISVYVEETGDHASMSVETQAKLIDLLSNPNAGMFLANEPLMKMAFGARESKEIAQAAQSQQQNMMMGGMPQGGMPQPPPDNAMPPVLGIGA